VLLLLSLVTLLAKTR